MLDEQSYQEKESVFEYNLVDFESFKKLLINEPLPSKLFEEARKKGIIDQYFPLLAKTLVTEQEIEWHQEGNVWEHTMKSLDMAAEIAKREGLSDDDRLVLMLAVLCHDLGKSVTSKKVMKEGVLRITSHKHDMVGGSMANELVASFDKNKKILYDDDGKYLGLESEFELDLRKKVRKLVELHMRPSAIYKKFKRGERTGKVFKKLNKALDEGGVDLKMLLMLVEADKKGRGSVDLELDEMLGWYKESYLS